MIVNEKLKKMRREIQKRKKTTLETTIIDWNTTAKYNGTTQEKRQQNENNCSLGNLNEVFAIVDTTGKCKIKNKK